MGTQFVAKLNGRVRFCSTNPPRKRGLPAFLAYASCWCRGITHPHVSLLPGGVALLFVLGLVGCGSENTNSDRPGDDGTVLIVTQDNFQAKVLQQLKPVLVDFWGERCEPCKLMNPVIKQLAQEHKGKAVIAKINRDNNRGLAQQFEITSIPAFLIFKDGKEVQRILGVTSKESLTAALEAVQ